MNIACVCKYFDQLLKLDEFAADPSNNGLQLCFDAQKECRKIAFAVDAALATVQQASAAGADLLVVHHGLSWGGEPRRWSGMTGRRLGEMFKNDLSLYAVHLPLDAHNIYGNNAVLADLMQLREQEMFFPYHGMNIGILGACRSIELEELAGKSAAGKGYKLYTSPGKNSIVSKVAVISGGGGLDGLECAIAAGADVLITGEFDHTMYHVVQENPVHVVALGHYNSEVHGVQSLQKLAAEELGLDTVFLDVPTGL